MKHYLPTLVFVLGAIALGLAGCTTPDHGPVPIPAITCEVRCSADTSLPYGAVLELRLVDCTHRDARPSVLAERIESNPGQPPLRFHLLYNTAAIDPTHDYAVEARILIKGLPSWVQAELAPVITKDNPVSVAIVLHPAT